MAIVVGMRELKTRLGTYLREVARGSTIVVTQSGRPVAELRPITTATDEEEARLDELAALGLLSRGSAAPLEPFEPIRAPGVSLSAAVLEGREDRL